MNRFTFFLNFALLLIVFIPRVVFAAPIPPELRPVCGYAGIDGATMCCKPLPLANEIEKTNNLLNGIPLFGGAIRGLSDGLRDIIFDVPLYQQISPKCRLGSPLLDSKTGEEKSPCTCVLIDPTAAPTPTGEVRLHELCEQYDNQIEARQCLLCAKKHGILTGLGCVPTDYTGFVSGFLLRIGIGLGGLISLGCIIIAAIQIQTSGGDAEKVSKAQEQIKSCLIGLMLVIFSILLLKLIGVTILGIPGFI